MQRCVVFFFGVLAATGLLAASASAAQIQLIAGAGGKNAIAISGRIEQPDAISFAQVAKSSNAGTVILDSAGGSVKSALEIGRLIRARGMSTLVTGNSYCVSACGLIWVAGARRLLTPGARIGFHATFTTKDSMQVESGVGNALIGRYLTLLNLPERAVVFATMAGPDNLNWLDADNKASSGIDLEIVESDYPSQTPVVASLKTSSLSKGQAAQKLEGLAFQKR